MKVKMKAKRKAKGDSQIDLERGIPVNDNRKDMIIYEIHVMQINCLLLSLQYM